MATLFKRPRSPYWWVQYAERGINQRKSTGFRHDIPAETRKAREMCARLELNQFKDHAGHLAHRWDMWVEPFLHAHYGTSKKSLNRARIAWRSLHAFLEAKRIAGPAHLTYDHCFAYVPWRVNGDAARGVYKISRNTALLELRFLGMIMEHAVRSGYAAMNPARRLGIAKAPAKEKPEITTEHMTRIWQALEHEPEWMRICFQIAFYTGCRLNETRIDLQDIDVVNRTITFRTPKGGQDRGFTVPMRDELVPLFERLQAAGRSHTIDFPLQPSLKWWLFFRRLRLQQYCFHCLRVTFITHGCRSGLSEREVMLLVNHASTTIHRVYQRWRVADLRSPLQRIQLHALGAAGATAGSADAS